MSERAFWLKKKAQGNKARLTWLVKHDYYDFIEHVLLIKASVLLRFKKHALFTCTRDFFRRLEKVSNASLILLNSNLLVKFNYVLRASQDALDGVSKFKWYRNQGRRPSPGSNGSFRKESSASTLVFSPTFHRLSIRSHLKHTILRTSARTFSIPSFPAIFKVCKHK